MLVGKYPGRTRCTRTPNGASSKARASVKESRLALLPVYAAKDGQDSMEEREERLRMWPVWRVRKWVRKGLVKAIGPKRFVWNWNLMSSILGMNVFISVHVVGEFDVLTYEISSTGPTPELLPTLLTSTSTCP